MKMSMSMRQVGRGEFQPAAFGFEQDVRQNGQRCSRADDILHGLESTEELVLGDGEVHWVLTMYLS